MVKLIGALLILSSILALFVGAYIESEYTSITVITGNAALNIITQPGVPLNYFDYIAGIAFSYSIISFIMGVMFLVRV